MRWLLRVLLACFVAVTAGSSVAIVQEQRNDDIKGQGRTAVAGGMKKAKAEFNK